MLGVEKTVSILFFFPMDNLTSGCFPEVPFQHTFMRGYLVRRGRPGKRASRKNNNKVILRVSFGNMSELRSTIFGIGHGLKDSLFGMTALLRLNSILRENHAENQFKADSQSSFRRPRHRARTSLNAPEKKGDR